MGEKGNVTATELAAAGSGAVVGAPGTVVSAVFEKAGDTLRDKVIDKGADAVIDAGAARMTGSDEPSSETPEPDADKPAT